MAALDPHGEFHTILHLGKNQQSLWLSEHGKLFEIDAETRMVFAVCFRGEGETFAAQEIQASHFRQNQLFEQILSTTGTAIFWKDTNRRFLGANQAFLDYYGFDSEDAILGKNDEEMGWHENPGPFKSDEERVLTEGISTFRVHGKCIAKGVERDIVASKRPISVDGKIVGLVGSFEDVTTEVAQDKKIADLNQELKANAENRKWLMNVSDVAIAKVSLRDYRFLEANDSLFRMFGVSRQDYALKYHDNMAEFFSGEYRSQFQKFQEEIAEAIELEKSGFSATLAILTPNGKRWINGATVFADYTTEGIPQSLFMVYRDITEVIAMQERLATAEKEAFKSKALAEQNERVVRSINGTPCGIGTLRIVNGVPEQTMQLNRYFFSRVALPAQPGWTAFTRDFPACLHPDDRTGFLAELQTFLLQKGFVEKRYRFQSKLDGSYYWVSVRCLYSEIGESDDIVCFVFTDINDFVIAQKQLQDSQHIYQQAVKAARLSTWLYDIDKHETSMSEEEHMSASESRWGFARVIANVPESLLPNIMEKDWPKVRAMYAKVNEGKEASCEFWFQAKPGLEPRCEKVTYIIEKSVDGIPHRAIGLGQNVTAEKKMEERYEREMGFLRGIEDNKLLAKGHFNLTKNLVIDYQTRSDNLFKAEIGSPYSDTVTALARLSYLPEEKTEILDKLDPENLMKRFRLGEMETAIVYRRSLQGQAPIWVSLNLYTYMSPETEDLELFSYAYDVSEKMETDEIMNHISKMDFDYIGLIFAENGRFEFIKKSPKILFPNLREIVAYDACLSYVKKNFVDAEERGQFDQATSLKNILAGLQANGHYVATYHRSENGKLLCKQLDYDWLDEASQIILVVRSDTTASFEREQAQLAKISAAKLEADRANEAKSAFLSSMSHDLRTPLNGVLGFTELALKETDPEKKQNYLEKIDSSGKLLLDLINDTLDLSRIDSGKSVYEPEAVDPEELIPAVITALRPSAELKGIHLDVDFANYPTELIWCDRLKTQKIFLNLLSNAIKYTPEGGQILVRFGSEKAKSPQKWLIFSVKDNGIGMSAAFLKTMYEPFCQEKRSESAKVPGTGLGLAIVKRFVDLLGGTIRCESTLHVGTTFVVSLPIEEVHQGVKEKKEEGVSALSLAGKRVLICEDNAFNQEIAVMLLKEKGIVSECAENGVVGLQCFLEHPAFYYDAVLMDLRMPRLDGIGCTEAIRKLERADAKSVPIIAMTADAFDESIKAAKDAGMDGYITKPLIPQKLFEELAKAFKKAE
jgi:PAS domain S-box-containing protein